MKVYFYSPNYIEPWSYKNLDIGIGGSETSHIELAWRLAAMEHEVISYTALPDGDGGRWRDVEWRDLSQANLSEDGLWMVYRQPSALKDFTPTPTRRAWLICQDVYYPDWCEHVMKCDRILALCQTHRDYLLTLAPNIKSKLVLSSNGVRVDLIDILPPVERHPRRLIYSSSPDRASGGPDQDF